MISLDSVLPVATVLLGVLNVLLLLRVLARLEQTADRTAQRRRQFRHAYAAHLLSQMRPHRTPTPAADAASPTVIDLGGAMSWRRRVR